MPVYCTTIRAICVKDGILKTYDGPKITAISFEDAQAYIDESLMAPYLKLDGRLESVIPCKPGTYEPDFDREIRYDRENLN